MAVIALIAYITIVYIFVKGFEQKLESQKLLAFVILGSVVGIFITFALRIQGIDLAKNHDDVKKYVKELSDLKSKRKEIKIKSITNYMISRTILDIFTKGITTALMTYYSISIVIEGIADEKYILLAIANSFLFLGFGFMGLAGAYNKYLEDELTLIKQNINKLKGEKNNELSKKITRTSENGFSEFGRSERDEDTSESNHGIGS